jgi:hypothetical protein
VLDANDNEIGVLVASYREPLNNWITYDVFVPQFGRILTVAANGNLLTGGPSTECGT